MEHGGFNRPVDSPSCLLYGIAVGAGPTSRGAMELRTHVGEDLSYVVVEPDGFDPEREYPVVYLLHGYLSNMRDLPGLSPSISRDGCLYVSPNAPIKIDMGPSARGFAWWSESKDPAIAFDLLSTLVERINCQYRVAAGRSLIGGFSQGAMLTYEFGLPKPDVFAGLFGLSGQVVDEGRLRASLPEGRGQSIFIAHGTEDAMLPIGEGRKSRDFLVGEGYAPEYREYRMAHQVSPQVLADLADWVERTCLSGGDDS